MTVVLGIDAAWTAKQPSGVALIAKTANAWHQVAVAPSYDSFVALAEGRATDWKAAGIPGSLPNVERLLNAARRLAGADVTVVAVDMPISTAKITGRRPADNLVSQEFGSRKCSTHTPNALRPGPLGEALSQAFFEAGYQLATGHETFDKSLIEVYPHPALLTLLNLDERLKYKVGKGRAYWPELSAQERLPELQKNLLLIKQGLDCCISGIHVPLPMGTAPTASYLKRFEDALDALICAWVGLSYVEGRARPLGDPTSAIWVPVQTTHLSAT